MSDLSTKAYFCLTICIATEVKGTFRVNGSNKRMGDLQAEFERAPRVRRANRCFYFGDNLLTDAVRKVFGLEEGELYDT